MRRHHILPTLTLLVALATAASGHEPIKDEPIKLVVTLVEVRSSAALSWIRLSSVVNSAGHRLLLPG